MKKGRRYIEPMTGRGDETIKKDVKKKLMSDEIFGKKEDDELKESYKQSLKNKKERDDKEKSVSELLREGFDEEQAALEKEEAEEGDQ